MHDECVRFGWSVPPPVLAALGEGANEAQRNSPHSALPASVDDGSIGIPVIDASTTSMTLAILGQSAEPKMAADITAEINEHPGHESVIPGTVMNILSRHDGVLVARRDKNRWFLKDADQAPQIINGYLYAKPSQLQRQELAAYRRQMILSVLEREGSGLMLAQIERRLEGMEHIAPVNKDALKPDLKALCKDGKIRQVGNSRKWELKGGAAYAAP
jgi:hypothetical protein